ncbi:MAG: inorganic phosphate transporter, partial [Actinomycetia bacterium]|nr:inorganic phosphate transporter [Actinomycetes bacterium]
IISGCYGAYSLGANNVANVTGVYVGQIFSLGNFGFEMTPEVASLIGAIAIIVGALTYSKGVMMTVGKNITTLDTCSAVISILGLAITLNIFTIIGVPVSSSQAIVGTVVGIGLVKGMKTVNKKTLTNIGIGWISTPLSSAAVTVLVYLAGTHLFGLN